MITFEFNEDKKKTSSVRMNLFISQWQKYYGHARILEIYKKVSFYNQILYYFSLLIFICTLDANYVIYPLHNFKAKKEKFKFVEQFF